MSTLNSPLSIVKLPLSIVKLPLVCHSLVCHSGLSGIFLALRMCRDRFRTSRNDGKVSREEAFGGSSRQFFVAEWDCRI